MFMTNSIFLDSFILIEYAKNKKVKLLDTIMEDNSSSCYINETVVSEFYFQFLKLSISKAPATLHSSNSIRSVLDNNKNYLFINLFEFIPNNRSIIEKVPYFMSKYNLLPNDAIILATCKLHNITKIASHNSDFIFPCEAEGIELLREDYQVD